MTKDRALEAAINLAKSAIESPSSNLAVYPNKESAESVADFIEALAARLSSM